MKRVLLFAIALLLALSPGHRALAGRPDAQKPVIQKVPLRYQVIARGARLNRKVMGEVTESIRGVPAQPVDSMVYDGDGSTPIEGMAILEIDPVRQSGMLLARWRDRNGSWELTQTMVHHPEHLSGVRIGASSKALEPLINLGAAQNVYLHGDTGAGSPALPTVFAYLATWGMARVTLDGEPFENPYGLPGPMHWHLHTMMTEGMRDEQGRVLAQGGEIYDPERHKDRGAVDPNDLELTVEFQDERFPRTSNYPSLYAFQYHVSFEDVVLRVTDTQTALDFDAAEEWFAAEDAESP